MKRFTLLSAVATALFSLGVPFIAGTGPLVAGTWPYSVGARSSIESGEVFSGDAFVATATKVRAAASVVSIAALERKQAETAAYLSTDSEHLGQKPVPVPVVVAPPASAGRSTGGSSAAAHRSTGSGAAAAASPRAAAAAAGVACPAAGGGGGSAPGARSAGGVAGTTTGDIQSFSANFNAIRAANCLAPIAAGNFRYDSCMEQRLFWIAEDPSTDPNSAWGHIGSVRSDGVPSVGCDGNLAGGSGNSGATVAQKWWDSLSHRAALYRPTVASTGGVCIYFAMVHGGIPNDPASFSRAAARWGSC